MLLLFPRWKAVTLYYLNIPDTCFTSLAPKGHRNCIQEHEKSQANACHDDLMLPFA